MNVQAFSPGATLTLSGTTTSSNAAFVGIGVSVEIQNSGAVTIFIKLGASTVTATSADYPLLAGQSKMLSRDPATQTHIAVITASGTATVYATSGEGL